MHRTMWKIYSLCSESFLQLQTPTVPKITLKSGKGSISTPNLIK
jgi:hypothetical protein